MHTLLKKIFALTLSLSLFVGHFALAQEVTADASSTNTTVTDTTPVTQTDSAVTVDASTTPQSTDAPQASSTPSQAVTLGNSVTTVQDAANTQPAASSQLLESTANPETATTSGAAAIPLASSTEVTSIASTTTTTIISPVSTTGTTTVTDVSVPVADTQTLDVVAQNVDAAPESAPVTPIEQAKLVALPLKVAAPEPQYAFALTGKQIPTKKKVEAKDGTPQGEQAVTQSLSPQVDNASGEVRISGQCADAYFVVLLYKNANDYSDDPRSYVLNRAYPCTNGAFSYAVTDLPTTLPGGTYYLLVGQEGERGSWTPITALTEISINRNQ